MKPVDPTKVAAWAQLVSATGSATASVAGAVQRRRVRRPAPAAPVAASVPSVPAPSSRPAWMVPAGIAGAVLLLGIAAYVLRKR